MSWSSALMSGVGFGAALAALLGLFRLLGKGVGWLIDRNDRRGDKLGVRLEALEQQVEALNAKMIILGGALAESVAELRHHAPESAGLARYERALRLAFPLTQTPDDIGAIAAEVDRLNRGKS